MPHTQLMLLWHMHQPYYKDLAEDRYSMPWVRLHALKDYYGMVAILKEFPSVHVTFNMAPSLVAQLLDYADGSVREESYELAFKRAEDLSAAEKEKLVSYAFQLNHENLLARYERLLELFHKATSEGGKPSARHVSSPQEILDIQVLSQLAWFDEEYIAENPEIHRLVEKQRNFNENDKQVLQKKESQLLKAILEEYREASQRGQIELSTSPFYHPILPLLCDTDVAAESRPGLRLPRRRFRHPEDARDQLRAAIKLHERVFGHRPRGLWPSEGSVSEEALRLAASEGFEWAATGEGVLGRSLQTYFHRDEAGIVRGGDQLYQTYSFVADGQSIDLFFRDHLLSDLIGFVYQRMDPGGAAADLIHKIRLAAASSAKKPAVISIILDGENAWEYYPRNGREFLREFYGGLARDPDIRAMTPSEILRDCQPATLPTIFPGSWINADFNVWIGAEEDNRAWDLLSDARDFFTEHSENQGISTQNRELARQELWIAEGSDWCWWYGPEHSTANDEEFDDLYRKHLGNIYRLLGGRAPDELASPIKRRAAAGSGSFMPPTAPIAPAIDGRETTYFEWMGAGVYIPDLRSTAIHHGNEFISQVFYGYGEKEVYLRLNFNNDFPARQRGFEIRISIGEGTPFRVRAFITPSALDAIVLERGDELLSDDGGSESVRAAFGSIFELAIPSSLLDLSQPAKRTVQVSLWADQLPVQVLPREGLLPLVPPQEPTGW